MAAPKTQFLMEDLISKVYEQKFPSGKLPTERALAASYGVSRYTVQCALRRLVEMGLLQVRQGDGVYVRKHTRGNPLIYNSATQVPYRDLRSQVLSLEKLAPTKELQAVFNLPPSAQVWRFVRIRIMNYEKTQIETGYMPCGLFPQLDEEVLADSIQNYVMEQDYRISYFMTNYRPARLTGREAELLNCKKATPAIAITSRGFLRGGTVFVYSKITTIQYECTYIVPFNKEVYLSRREKKQP